MSISDKLVNDLVANQIEFVTTVPCKQLGGVIEGVENHANIQHVPCNKEDEGIGLCAGAWMGGKRPAIIMQISYRGELREPVSCQVEMAVHTKALLDQLLIPTYHFHNESDADEFDAILKYCFMSKKPVAILTDANFWGGY